MNPVEIKPRVWPALVILVLLVFLRYLLPFFKPETYGFAVMSGIFLAVVLGVWWIFFSKVSAYERLIFSALIILSLTFAWFLLDRSILTGNMGLMYPIYSIPVMAIAFICWVLLIRTLSYRYRYTTMVMVVLIVSGFWITVRSEGIDGNGKAYLVWRWSETAEERLSEKKFQYKKSEYRLPEDEWESLWNGFRGNERNGTVQGLKITTDWTKYPPAELWRRPVGPGCSSFAVLGNFLYTQEQSGEDEMVSCYNLLNGEVIWKQCDKTRFWDSHAGAGPRGTPFLYERQLYTLGATGILNVLDAGSGVVIWSRNVAAETGTKLPNWAFCGSPLVFDDLVVVALAGSLIAYDRTSGEKRWSHLSEGEDYSSPHLLKTGKNNQILFADKNGITGYDPADGKPLWKNDWPGNPILQPAIISEQELLVCTGLNGIRKLSLSNQNGIWKAAEEWTSTRLKPNHNDFVVHKGFVYGMDMAGLSCVDTKDGTRRWKGGRYGGQMLLLADQDLLLIVSEKGEVIAVEANPDQFHEIGRFKAIKGKTWNHPAIAGDVLIVRNAEEMAAFRLPVIPK